MDLLTMYLLNNVLLFLSVIFLATLCGLGLLQLFGLRDFQQRLLLAPSMALAVSGIFVALVVLFGIPVGGATSIFWVLWMVFAIYGALHVRSALIDLDRGYILWISILLTMLVSGGFIYYGVSDYLGSSVLDGWSYVSFGEYLRQYPKGTEGGLAPMYQYAAHLSGTRYVASAMLAVLIPPWSVGIDTQMTVGPLLILSIFSFALSVAYAAQMANQRGLDTPAWLAVLFGVVGGWVPHALHMNNYDNLLALPFAPALFALASDRNLNSSGQIFLPAIFIAASIYIYPELSPLIIAAYGVVAVEGFLSSRSGYKNGTDKRIQLFKYAMIAVMALVIVSPYLRDAMHYFGRQLSSTARLAGRPGEGIMPSLLDSARVWGGMWGLGSKDWGIIVGVLLGQIAFFGVVTAATKKYFSIILYLVLIGALFVVMVMLKHYDYGAYKVLLLGWWAIAIVLAAGAKGIWGVVPSSNMAIQKTLQIAIIAIFLGATNLWLTQQYIWVRGYTYKTATGTREARDAVLNIQGPVQVSVSDPTLNAWLVYQLRGAKVLFTEFHGYMDQPHVRPLMARSMAPSQNEIQYLLADINKITTGKVMWKSDTLKLVKSTFVQQLPDIAIHAPNGREILDGKPFFWLGREPASIIITAPESRVVRIDLAANVGPSVGSLVKDYPNVFIENAGKQLLEFDAKSARTHTVRFALTPGSNTLVFRQDYAGNVVPNQNGDPRTLLVGIKIVKMIVDDE